MNVLRNNEAACIVWGWNMDYGIAERKAFHVMEKRCLSSSICGLTYGSMRNEDVCRRISILRELAYWAKQWALWGLGHVEKMKEEWVSGEGNGIWCDKCKVERETTSGIDEQYEESVMCKRDVCGTRKLVHNSLRISNFDATLTASTGSYLIRSDQLYHMNSGERGGDGSPMLWYIPTCSAVRPWHELLDQCCRTNPHIMWYSEN